MPDDDESIFPNDDPSDDMPREEADLDDPRKDRPGGPGQAGGNIVAPGEVSPAPVGGGGEQDDTVQERREHLKEKEDG